MADRVFSGDVGGTKIRMGLWELQEEGRLCLIEDWTIASAEVSCLSDALCEIAQNIDLAGLCAGFGVAGPVKNGIARLVNLPWTIDSRGLEKEFGFGQVLVINDVEATAWAVPSLKGSKICEVKSGSPIPEGPVAIVAPGTGLGQAGLIRTAESPVIFSGEGGHADFAPRGPIEIGLADFLAQRYGHVSWERVLSGPGLVDLADFFFKRKGISFEEWCGNQGDIVDRAAAVASAGKAGDSEPCVLALNLFVKLLGAQAGNVALTMGATGGVFLAGGIPPKILPAIREGIFSESFVDKGRMRPLLEAIPVSVILDQDAPLLGAAHRAAFELLK